MKNGLRLGLFLLLFVAACARNEPYLATFDEAGAWAVGDELDVNGAIVDGRYELTVKASVGAFWTTANEQFSSGIYTVEATQTAGTLDAGYGMMFRVNNESNSFYLFEISSDGFVWIGLCENACSNETILVGNNPAGWFESDAIVTGLGETNTLRVEAEQGNLIFFINDIEVGRRTDTTLAAGDIGLLVETLGIGDVTVAFDNFSVTPLAP